LDFPVFGLLFLSASRLQNAQRAKAAQAMPPRKKTQQLAGRKKKLIGEVEKPSHQTSSTEREKERERERESLGGAPGEGEKGGREKDKLTAHLGEH
jgi:hypothetical protein